jgi:hypothetical protein
MRMPELPDDLKQWPSDPYRLLGVRPGAAADELRRAYVRLIRRFKPEQHPEHFRRIRDAYEAIQALAAWWPPAQAEPDLLPPPTPMPEPDEETPLPTHAGRRSDDDELASAWELACCGDEASAYQRLRRMHERQPHHAGTCARLYWLLSLWPQLDAGRQPCDWLARGLRAGEDGSLRELYRRELAVSPAEALSPRCRQVLEGSFRPGLLLDLVECRWRAARGTRQPAQVIGDDLHALRERLRGQDEDSWLRLLLLAARQLTWCEGEAAAGLAQRCREELEQLAPVEGAMRHELDLLDHLSELAAGWWALRQGPEPPTDLLLLLGSTWERPWAEMRPRLLRFLEAVADAPQSHLVLFDQVRQVAPAVLTQFGNLLAELQAGLFLPPGPPADELKAPLRELLALSDWSDYEAFRLRLLRFCLEEAFSPEAVAEALWERTTYVFTNGQTLAQVVLDDYALRYVWLAHRLFWA